MTARTRILSAAAALLFAAGTLPADALAEGRAGHRRAPASGRVHRETTRTGSDGQTRTRQKDTTWQRSVGQATRDTTWTGANGKTATRHTEVQKTEDGRASESTLTRPDGSTTTTTRSVTRGPAPEGE